MATSVEPTVEDDTLEGLSGAFGEFADSLVGEEDADDAALEADLTETAPEAVEAEPEVTDVTEPAADAAATTPATEAEADPLANAKPLDYTVDGQAKSYDGIRVLTNADGSVQGAVIPPEALKDVQYRLQRGDYLETQNKALYGQVQDLERFSFKTPDGTEHRGLAAVDAQAIEHAKISAAARVMADVIENPDKLIALAFATQSGDQSEIQRLTREISIAAKEAQWNTREQRGQMVQRATQEATQQQERGQVTGQAITASVNHWASQFPSLTQDDKDKAVAHFSKLGSAIVRQATPDEAKAAGVKPGELIIDHPVIHEWLADRAGLRTQQQTATVEATTKAQLAAKENALRLAAAAKGKPNGQQKKSPSATKSRKTEEVDEGETWSQQRARLMRGELTSSDDD